MPPPANPYQHRRQLAPSMHAGGLHNAWDPAVKQRFTFAKRRETLALPRLVVPAYAGR